MKQCQLPTNNENMNKTRKMKCHLYTYMDIHKIVFTKLLNSWGITSQHSSEQQQSYIIFIFFGPVGG